MTEQEIRNILLKSGARDFVCADELKNLSKPYEIGMRKYMEVREFCQEQGAKNIREWLIERGLYCDIERDMLGNETKIDQSAEPAELCAQILDRYPLAGGAWLSEENVRKILKSAQRSFDKLAYTGLSTVPEQEQDVLFMAIILHLQLRERQDAQEAEQRFWPYIYSCFGYRNPDGDTQCIYNKLRDVVRDTLSRRKRYFSSEENTQQYYTSLNLHALAPRQSMNTLFEILLYFYVEDLEFNYTPGDPAFKAVVNCIANRWDKDIEHQEGLNVRSGQMASGLKALFSERRGFMSSYCEKIVGRIDALVRGSFVAQPDDTLDHLLEIWYAQRDNAQDALHYDAKRVPVRRISAASDRIRLQYIFDGSRVCLLVPQIRLENKADDYPQLHLYQGERLIYDHEMDVFGRLSWTTREMQIPLEETEFDFDDEFKLRAEIIYDNEKLFDSATTLHRRYIIFGENGRERVPMDESTGRVTVFAPEHAEISEGDDDVWIGNRGKLIQVFADGDRAFTVNGEELFMNRERKDSIRIYARRDRVHGLRGCSGGQAFDIYDEPISLQVYLPEGGNVLQYRIGVDDEPFRPLGDYCGAGERDFVLTVPDDSIKRHRIRINDVGSGKTVSEFSYAILPGVKVKPDHKLIYDDAKQVSGKICYDGCDLSLSDYPPESGDWLEVTPEHLPYALEVRLPLVRGTLRDQNIFELPHMTWWTQLRSDAFVKLQVPTGWEAALYLGACAVPKNPTDGSFELSNLISSGYRPGKTAGLSLKMQSRDGLQDIRILGNIAFEEHFTSSPVLLDGGTLKWQPEGRYVGPEDDELRLQVDIDGQTPFEYVVACNRSETLDRRFSSDLGYGEYPFRLLKKQGIFAKEKVVYEDTLPVGEPAMWRLRGKYLYLKRARCWDSASRNVLSLDMPTEAGRLCDIEYMEYDKPYEEDEACPKYTARLYFYNNLKNEWRPFSDRETYTRERINPVYVWRISETMLVIRTADEEALMVNRITGNICSQSMSAKEAKNKILPADYFEYDME